MRTKTSGRWWRRAAAGAAMATLLGTAVATPADAMTRGVPVTDPNSAPWVATLAFRTGSALVPGDTPLLQRATCGGALISPTRVLTAGHCVDHVDPSQLEVHVGARVLSQQPGEVRTIARISVLPGYRVLPSPVDPADDNLDSASDDLAIVELSRPVTDVPPLPTAPRRPAPGTPVSLFAHGTTGLSGADFRDDVLHRGDLTVIDHATCQAATPATVDEPSVNCAEDDTGGVNMCYQDSGSPVVEYHDGRPALAGIASFGGETAGKPCADTPEPVAFANVPAFRDWSYQPFPPGQPYPSGQPVLSGEPRPGAVLRCVPPRWDAERGDRPDRISYQWATVTQEGGFAIPTPIPDATGTTFTVTAASAGESVTCLVDAANPYGTTETIARAVTVG